VKKSTPAIDRNLKLLIWFNFFTDFKLYAPLAIIYFSKVSGSYALGTSILSIAMISSALFEVPTGIFSDYIGRKKTIILGTLSSFLAICFYAASGTYLILVIGAILEGLARSLFSGNNEALLYDSLASEGKQRQYHHFLGRLSSLPQLALGISALLGGLFVTINFQLTFWLSSLAQLICLVLAFQLKEPLKQTKISANIYSHLKDSFQFFMSNKNLRLLSLSSILSFGLGEASFQFRSAFYITIWPVWALGIASMVSNFLAVIGFWVSGKVIDKFGGMKILFIGALYNRFADFMGLIFPTPASPILMSTTSLHYGVSSTARGSMMQKEFTSIQRATMGSLNAFAGSIFFAIVTFLLGLTADKLNPRLALILLEVFLLSNLFIYWKLIKTRP